MITLSIDWNPDPIIFHIGGFGIRYYSLLFVVAFVVGLHFMKKIFINDKVSLEKLDPLFMYTILSMFIGMRLGEVFFYSWDYYQHHLLEILLPIKEDPKGTLLWFIDGYRFTGFQGLASHGAAVGIIIGLYLYSKNILKMPLLWLLDRIALVVLFAGFCVRMGNLMNSEIYGKPTDLAIGFIFTRAGETIPRHPTQIYEALSYLLLFFIVWFLYWKTDLKKKTGFLFGLSFTALWTVRFVIEYFKEAQVASREDWVLGLNTGQVLSLPLILIGIYFVVNKNGK
ncbi:MAG: prolipoprotein diacylglyceryl transferase [Flavobacteriaceae bacterium]|nr:MAG: prolipoprotein diacylglyceryl transferase [Flavobacteriaceae bacterium]